MSWRERVLNSMKCSSKGCERCIAEVIQFIIWVGHPELQLCILGSALLARHKIIVLTLCLLNCLIWTSHCVLKGQAVSLPSTQNTVLRCADIL